MNASTVAATIVATAVISLGILAAYALILAATAPKQPPIQYKDDDVE